MNDTSCFFQSQQVIKEMNRLGMLIDLAHVTVEVMNQVLDMSAAPVIFSHSSAYAICPHKRNVPDNILLKVVSSNLRREKFYFYIFLQSVHSVSLYIILLYLYIIFMLSLNYLLIRRAEDRRGGNEKE